MAKTPKSVRSVLDPTAYQLAFQIAQSLERTLIADAVKFAANDAGASGDALVTATHVLCALDESTLEKACLQIGITLDGKTKSLKKKNRRRVYLIQKELAGGLSATEVFACRETL